MTTHDALIATAAVIGASFGYQIARHRYERRRAPAVKPVYMKCRDCGLEHAVYPTGEIHALRQEPKAPAGDYPGRPQNRAIGKGDSLEFDG